VSVIAAIRPEDIEPVTSGEDDTTLSTLIKEMEFLGSFYRVTLFCAALGDIELMADFSINAVRRLKLSVGETLGVRLPAARLKIFPVAEDAAS